MRGGCGDQFEVCEKELDTWIKDTSPPLDVDNMLGSYMLESVNVSVYEDGDWLGHFDSDNGDLGSVSGSMSLTESTLLSMVTFEGWSRFIGGPYTKTDNDAGQTGVFHIEDTSEGLDLHYSIYGVCERPGEDCIPRLTLLYELCETVSP